MATQAPETPPESPTAQRTALTVITSAMLAQLRSLWPSLDVSNLQGTLRYDVLPAVVSEYGDAAATLAADWYDNLRDAYRVPGSFTATLVDQPADDMLRAISNWAAAPAEATTPDLETALARTEGVTQKIVANMHRDTVRGSSARDHNGRGWARFTEPDACDFCLMLSSRGGVYTTETVRFGSHDHCHCLAGPVWAENRDVVDKYQRSHRPDRLRERQNALARKWIAENVTGGKTGKARKVEHHEPADSGLKGMTDERLNHLIGITDALPDTPYKAMQLKRLRDEKKRRGI